MSDTDHLTTCPCCEGTGTVARRCDTCAHAVQPSDRDDVLCGREESPYWHRPVADADWCDEWRMSEAEMQERCGGE